MLTGLFSGAVLLGLMTALWGKIKGLLMRAYSVFIVKATIQGDIATAFKAHCWKNYRRSPFGTRRYASDQQFVRPSKRTQIVGFEKLGIDPVLFWNGWRPMLVGANNNGCNGSSNTPNETEVVVSFIRGTFKLDKLLSESVDDLNAHYSQDSPTSKRYYIERIVGMGGRRSAQTTPDGNSPKIAAFSNNGLSNVSLRSGEVRLLKWKIDDIGPDIEPNRSAMDALAYPPEVMTLVEELRHWKASEKWYREKLIPWTRGWLLYGKPGTGKTSLVRAIAQDLDLPVFVIDLASMSNSEFIRAWERIQNSAPCIVLLEDMDAVFKGRVNVLGEEGGGLTFDCLLNCLGGIENANGIFKVITTNCVEDLDEALGVPRQGNNSDMSTRPGRVDRALELKVMTEPNRRKLAERILCDCQQHIVQLVIDGDGDSPAQFQDRCARIALAEHWKQKEIEDLLPEIDDNEDAVIEMVDFMNSDPNDTALGHEVLAEITNGK